MEAPTSAAEIAKQNCPSAPPASAEPSDIDVLMTGPLFLDMVFTGLPNAPQPGTETWAEGMGTLPGGIANLAVATARLGLRTMLATGIGKDAYGQWCRQIMEEERIDLSRTIATDMHTNVTVSYAHDDDRTMITHAHPLPVSTDQLWGEVPTARAVAMDLTAQRTSETWWQRAHEKGAKIFADVGWDASGKWDRQLLSPLAACYAFVPNEVEACRYAGVDDARLAAKHFAEMVPLAVVTCGAKGAIAINAETGEEAAVPALRVTALDPTGAGDVFASALIAANLAGCGLSDQLAFATLCSSLAVQQFGGSLAAPGWGDIRDWYERANRGVWGDQVRRRYGFLADLLPAHECCDVRRAEATIALQADF